MWYLLDNKEFPTLKSPNQNVVFIGYYILIGCFSRTFEYEFQTHTTKSSNQNTRYILSTVFDWLFFKFECKKHTQKVV